MRSITLLFLFITVFAYSQRFHSGVNVGLVTSQVDGDTYAGFTKLGFTAGGFVSKRFSADSKWNALFEINYIQKGSRKLPHPDKGDYSLYKLNLNYVEVPVLLSYDFRTTDTLLGLKNKFSLEFGLAFAALVGSFEEDTYGQLPGAIPFQKKDISVLAGIRYNLTKNIIFNIRTEYSALPVRKGGTSTYYQNWTYKFIKPGYYNNLLCFVFHYDF